MTDFINSYVIIITICTGIVISVLSVSLIIHTYRRGTIDGLPRLTHQDMLEKVEKAELKAAEALRILQLHKNERSHNEASNSFLQEIIGKGHDVERNISVENVACFTIEDRSYYADLYEGQYLIDKTLNDLESELDPKIFFRIKRDYIVNRFFVLNYTYWENGKYIVRIDSPNHHEIIVPRARMQEFTEWLNWSKSPIESEQPYAGV